jgi:hypothetical protein
MEMGAKKGFSQRSTNMIRSMEEFTSAFHAARYIVPVSRSAAEQIKALRQMASGKFISASTPGVYQYQENPPASRRRVMRDLYGPLTVMPPSKSEA